MHEKMKERASNVVYRLGHFAPETPKHHVETQRLLPTFKLNLCFLSHSLFVF